MLSVLGRLWAMTLSVEVLGVTPPSPSSHTGQHSQVFILIFFPLWNRGSLQQLLGQLSWEKHRLGCSVCHQQLLGQGWSQAVIHNSMLQSRGLQEVNQWVRREKPWINLVLRI